MLIKDAMSRPARTIPESADCRDAAGVMIEDHIGSVLVVPGSETVPSGILTESDLLRETHETDDPLSEHDVAEVMSSPLVTVDPDRTLSFALDLMLEHGIKRLPVMHDLEPVGVVSLTDIAFQHDDIRAEALKLSRREGRWS